MQADWTLVTGPTLEPISLDEAKRVARIEVDDENAQIAEWIVASRIDAEEYMSRGLLTQTLKLVLDYEWADEMYLPRAAPLQSVTHVKYYDSANTLQTLATTVYAVDTVPEPGGIYLKPDQVWPSLKSRRGAIEITYVVGWETAAKVPALIRAGIGTLVTARIARATGKAWDDAWQAATGCWSPYIATWKPPVTA